MIALSSFPNPTPLLFGQGLQSKVRLFQISTLSFCLCPHHPTTPWASLVLDLKARFSPLPYYFGLTPYAVDCLFSLVDQSAAATFLFTFHVRLFCVFFLSASHPYSIHPASFSSPFISLTFQLCQSALSLDPFWKRSHAFGFSSHFCYIPRLFFHPNVALFLLF